MKSALLGAVLGAVFVFSSHAQSVAQTNLFDPNPGGANPVTATSSSVYSSSFPVTNVNDGTSAIFVFGGSDTTTPSLNFTGFNSAIGSIQFYDSNYADRRAPSVSIYYAPSNTTSLSPANYIQAGSGSFTLTYGGTTTGASNIIGGHQLMFASVSGLGIPAGTRSVLFVFGPTGGSSSSVNSYGIAEIEAFATDCNPPAAFTVGGSGYTTNTTQVTLSGSEIGVTYQLYLNGTVAVSAAQAGTGSAMNSVAAWGGLNTAGAYTIVAARTSDGCTQVMNDSAVISDVPGDGSLADTNIKYFGRWDFSNPSQDQSYWGGAYFKVNFSGTTVMVNLGVANNYYAKIDSAAWVTYSNVSGTVNLTPMPLATGEHSLSVAEGKDYSYVFNFQGLSLDSGARTSLPMVNSNLIEFIGDSITCGYTDPQANVSDYAWICAENLNCEHTQIAYPGIALVNGYGINSDKTGMDTAYFKLQPLGYASPSSWNFTNYTPRLVVINLGQNDQSVGVPVAAFQSDYTNFLYNIRTNFPNADIFAMRPFSGAMAAQVLAAVSARNGMGDSRVHYVDTTGWLNSGDFNDGVHPSVSGQIKAAGLLQPILSPYVAPPSIRVVGMSSGAVDLFWPTSAVSYNLESTTNLSLAALWLPVTNPVTNNGGTNLVSLGLEDESRFFRLSQ